MGRPSSGAQQRSFVKAKRRKKNKTTVGSEEVAAAKPIKVVYISNPMRVTTSAAKFRGLVQRLTGRHSTVADTPVVDSPSFVEFGDDINADELSAEDSGPGSGAPAAATAEGCRDEEALWGRHLSSDSAAVLVDQCKSEEAAATAFEVLDDAFGPSQMLEHLPPVGLPQSPPLYCESLISRWILETL